MKRTNIYLDERQTSALDGLAHARGLSRAELIRRILDQAIGEGPTDEVAEQMAAIEESFGVLRDEDDLVMRGPDERSRHLDRHPEGTRRL
ncbi:MAG: ribbon-helix-helix protein, CopG family [Chloroflexi bacterium]|nr:ribbon-helix-helix protein, CopG family [Chloroflexota bacterium]